LTGDTFHGFGIHTEELAFREEIRAWVKANLPADISQKVHSAMRLTRDGHATLGQNFGQKGLAWLGLARAIWRPRLERCSKGICSKRNAL
jgi:hypothetical protein